MELKAFDQYSCQDAGDCGETFWVSKDEDPEHCPYCFGEVTHDFEIEAALEGERA